MLHGLCLHYSQTDMKLKLNSVWIIAALPAVISFTIYSLHACTLLISSLSWSEVVKWDISCSHQLVKSVQQHSHTHTLSAYHSAVFTSLALVQSRFCRMHPPTAQPPSIPQLHTLMHAHAPRPDFTNHVSFYNRLWMTLHFIIFSAQEMKALQLAELSYSSELDVHNDRRR